MGHDPDREPPFFFAKPADALLIDDANTPYPPQTADFHFEVELVVAIGARCTNVDAADAPGRIWGYAVGIDFTRRDLQAVAKKLARPWEMAKGFDASAPIGALVPAAAVADPAHGRIALTVNGETRQQADLGDMIWSPPEAIAHLSASVTLMPGDLIFTGTPAGVGAVVRGDRVEAMIDGIGNLRTTIA
jgi:fumarylpyruvate hydrolase